MNAYVAMHAAELLKVLKPAHNQRDAAVHTQWLKAVLAVADRCDKSVKRFDRVQFYKDCGISE